TFMARWQWRYYQQNRWRFAARTAMREPAGDAFSTWDLPRIFAAIDQRFQKALGYDTLLKAIPIQQFEPAVDTGNLPAEYRPTLYDLVAHEALQFYTAGEQSIFQPEDPFTFTADSPAFASAKEFMQWKPQTTHTNSATLRAIQTFQALLRFHEHDRHPTAFIDADVARLVFAKQTCPDAAAHARFASALEAIARRWPRNEAVALAYFHWAESLFQEKRFDQARKVALRGQRKFPKSPGGKQCHNLIATITAPSAAVAMDQVWAGSASQVQIVHKNLKAVHFRAVPMDWDLPADQFESLLQQLSDLSDEKNPLLKKKPVAEWKQRLPSTPDFKWRQTKARLPKLRPGCYLIVASYRPDFAFEKNRVFATIVWISDLALVIHPFEKRIEGVVLNAISGDPISNAQVEVLFETQPETARTASAETNAEGCFRIDLPNEQKPMLLRVRAGAKKTGSLLSNDFWWEIESHLTRDHSFEQTFFFTDRAIYRPGQIIHFKGICLRRDTGKNEYEVVSGRALTVGLLDAKQNEVARVRVESNEFGSFSGSFVVPRTGLLGNMMIRAITEPRGSTAVSIEEYKKPRFRVDLAPLSESRLNEWVHVQGDARSLTGAAIDGASVRYRVKRSIHLPYDAFFDPDFDLYTAFYLVEAEDRLVAHGSTRTDENGRFEIKFLASRDPKEPGRAKVQYSFEITVEVTDPAGETRSAEQTALLSEATLQAQISAAEWQTTGQPVEFSIRTQNLNRTPQSAHGRVEIFALKQPARVHPEALEQDSQSPIEEMEEITYQLSEQRSKPTTSNPASWTLRNKIAEQQFQTGTNGLAHLHFSLPAGAYRAVLETRDRHGTKVQARHNFIVMNTNSAKFPVKVPAHVATPSSSLQPGQEFVGIWGSGYDRARALIEIEHRQKILQRFWTDPARTQQRFAFSVDESLRGGFTVHLTQVRDNRAAMRSLRVDVPWINKEFNLRWEHFTSKLLPDQKETWTAVVETNEHEPVSAEMVATLYDAALDEFRKPEWTRGFGSPRGQTTSWEDSFGLHFQQLFYQNASSSPKFLNRNFWLDVAVDDWDDPVTWDDLRYPTFTQPYSDFFPPQLRYYNASPYPEIAPAATPPSAPPPPVPKANLLAEPPPEQLKPEWSQIPARKNLNETAFFFPHLRSDSKGVVRFEFTMPEALTEWRFLGFAHDRQLRSGFLEARAVTSRELMIQPNPPRFLREGDQLEFT
ncbi:MAG: MG2 domain-containing protein, partial [Verrucomicrobiota bacterium]